MKINLVNKVCSMLVFASLLSAPIGVAFADGPGPAKGGDHGGAGGNHGGGGSPTQPPAPAKPAPAQPTPPAPHRPDPSQPNNPPPGPRPDGGDNGGNDVGAEIGGAIVLGDIIGGLFANLKAVNWNWVEATDSTGGYTLDCYGYNSKGVQVGKPTNVSKCANVPQPIVYIEQTNTDGTQSCYEYYAPDGQATDILNDGNPMTDDSLCATDTADSQ